MASSEEFVFYHYEPRLAVAANYATLFSLLATIEIIWIVVSVRRYGNLVPHKRCRKIVTIMIPYLIGFIMEAIGYIARCFSAKNKEELMPYIIQSLTILVAPSLIAATFYMLLGQIIGLLDAEHLSPVKRKFLTKIFVIGDVVSFFLQSGGGGIMAQGNMSTGRILVIAGLVIQIIFFCGFTYVIITFLRRILQNPTKASSISRNDSSFFGNWLHALWTLIICSVFILIRCVFRVIEYIQGNDGYLMSREVYFFAFDSVMIFLCGVTSEIFGFPRFLLRFEVRFTSTFRDEHISLNRMEHIPVNRMEHISVNRMDHIPVNRML